MKARKIPTLAGINKEKNEYNLHILETFITMFKEKINDFHAMARLNQILDDFKNNDSTNFTEAYYLMLVTKDNAERKQNVLDCVD